MDVARIMYTEAAAWHPRICSARAMITPHSDDEATRPSSDPAAMRTAPASTMRRSGTKSPKDP